MIQTVTGPIPREKLGITLMHEHIQCVSRDMLHTFGSRWLDEDKFAAYAVRVLRLLREQTGITAFVDGTPCDLGRDIWLLKRVSREAAMPIVASTGLYWFPGCLTFRRSAQELSELFIDECQRGMEGSGILPGILKCATDAPGVTEDNARRLAALGIAQCKTGLPLYAHCRHTATSADDQLDVLLANGADPHKIILGHASARLDTDYLEHLLRRECWISIDQCRPGGEEKAAKVIAELCARGWNNRILLSMDHPIYNEFEAAGRTGEALPEQAHVDAYAFLFRALLPALRREGCPEEVFDGIMRENPAEFLDV